jgi:hypothetical protein
MTGKVLQVVDSEVVARLSKSARPTPVVAAVESITRREGLRRDGLVAQAVLLFITRVNRSSQVA